MAKNTLPKSISELLDLAQHNINGINSLGTTIGLLQYTSANFTPKRTSLVQKQDAFNDARTALAAIYAPVHTHLRDIRRACITGRKLLSITLGDDWSPAWVSPGWPGPKTAVPTEEGPLILLATNLENYLTTLPDFEVSTPKITFTATNFQDLLSAFTPLRAALNAQHTTLNTARDNRAADETVLRKFMRGLIGVLTQLLSPNDPRWDQFGLNRPGATVTPGQPAAPSLSLAAPGTVLAITEAVPLTTYYRWKYQLVGVDNDFRFWGRTSDPLVQLSGQPAAGLLRVKVEAANEAGPGKASAVSEIELGE